MSKFVIEGQKPLKGEITAQGSKNAALPIIAATLLSDEESVLTNIPDIADVHSLLNILEYLNVKTSFKDGTLKINPKNIINKQIPHELVSRMRASILLLAPILVKFHQVKIAFPGGCVLGKRPIDAHLTAFEKLGSEVFYQNEIHITTDRIKAKNFSMPEMSVTATENAIMTACFSDGISEIRLVAAEPHIQDLCLALNQAGAKIEGIGTHTLKITGVKKLQGLNHKICSDYLEVGTYALASALTGGHIIIKDAVESHLDSFWQKLKEVGVHCKHYENSVEIFPSLNLKASNLRTAVFPSFPTDLQAQFAVLLTQAEGRSKVFETLFEGKMNYIFELEKMGAKIAYLNNHQALIFGKTKLKGTSVASLDIRAGAAMVLAALCAEGESEITNINYIDRGYQNLEKNLKKLGAKIKRIKN
jgi:UDP-N-acetylglucosamine 1-carboxyvinyltransferase